MKKISKIISIFLFISLIFVFQVRANAYETVYLGGQSIGIKMNTGVYIVGKFQVNTDKGKISPWQNSNIEIGDKIDMINGIRIASNAELLNYLSKNSNDTINLTLLRDNMNIRTDIQVVKNDNNESSLGLYIKDQIQGIGTMSFITNDGYFASLGHGIYENKKIVEQVSGSLYYSSVASIRKSEPGNAGEKKASINNQKIGEIIKNDTTGLYGKIELSSVLKKEVGISNQSNIKKDKAYIYTTLTDNIVRGYEIEIIDVDNQTRKASKGIKFKVTDARLIDETGGIVQGMSGSPIVQNNQIIGAVSHVTVENPIFGYGMHVEFMIDEIETITANY